MREKIEIAFYPYKDEQLSLWMKVIVIGIWTVNLAAGLLYQTSAHCLLALTGMIVLLGGNIVLTAGKPNYRMDVVAFVLLAVPNLLLFLHGCIGFFSMFYLLLYSVAVIFIMGIRYSLILNIGIALFLLVFLRGSGRGWLEEVYSANEMTRYPYLYVCFVGIATIIMYSIQGYWREKERRSTVLAERIKEEKSRLAEMSMKIIQSMYGALSAKIPEIDRHCERVAEDSRRIAKRLQLDETTCTYAYYAGLLHEVGAVGLPDEVLERESLTEEQYAVFRTYVVRGYRIICELQINEEVAQAVLHHRENYDGSGYPDGSSGEEIPLLARLLAVADYADRHRRRGESAGEICNRLTERSGSCFDPVCVREMCAILQNR